MSVEMTPLSGGSVQGAYLGAAEARTLGASLPGLTTLLTQSDDDLAILLYAASLDIDAAMPYQGVKYDTTDGGQERQFPRYKRVVDRSRLTTPSEASSSLPGAGVWDWDSDANTAVVPNQVKIACLYQAASLLNESFQSRLEAIRSGMASQSVGSMSESYLKPADLPGGLTGLCDKAQRYMDKYRLRTAEML